MDPRTKRLAVEVEPHPIEYASFEGTIPKGEYGGGTVLVWDQGHWIPDGDPTKAYKRGRLTFALVGSKLQGEWHLVRSGSASDGKSWLLFKGRDEYASAEGDRLLEDSPRSVVSGRDIDEVATGASRVWRSNRSKSTSASNDRAEEASVGVSTSKARKAGNTSSRATNAVSAKNKASGSAENVKKSSAKGLREPSRQRWQETLASVRGVTRAPISENVQPELATLADSAPVGDDWIHELKFDGYRILAQLVSGKVRLLTRRGNDWTSRMPTLARAIERLNVESAMLDGEFVALDERGISNFQSLQNQLSMEQDAALVYYVFDLLYLNGFQLREAALLERKRILRDLLESADDTFRAKVRYSEHVVGNGPEYFQAACDRSLEGIISKRGHSPYVSKRTRDWVKVKCLKRQEFVIVGFTRPGGARRHFGAILVAVRSGEAYAYAGRVGTGFSERSLEELHRRLLRIRATSPCVSNPPRDSEAADVQWVRPELVAEVSFLSTTDEGMLRHASFCGLREDKEPKDVTLEVPVMDSRASKGQRTSEAEAERARSAGRKPSSRGTNVAVALQSLTNPDKLMYPELGITKRELLEYYAAVAEHMLPHDANRPLTLVRCPNGHEKPCFFQKHPSDGTPPAIHQIAVREKEAKAPYSVIDDVDGLLALVQIGVLEVHTWGSRIAHATRPDVLVFDLDPDVDLPFESVIECAIRVRELFAGWNLESFVKTTGGKGLHVCIPIEPDLEWDDAKAFCHRVADEIVKLAPERYLATQSKAKRKGKIFIDYLRNGRGATFVAPYSTRARVGAPIATPVEWDELTSRLRPDQFNIRNIGKRLAKLRSDPFARMLKVRQRLRT